MDAFEQLVGEILWMRGYWVRTSVKVKLTKEDEQAIGRYSSPRWELDVVAYRGRDNELLIVECKSFIDSAGVRAVGFEDPTSVHGKRYKLFNEPKLRDVVLRRLRQQFADSGACATDPKARLALACGKIRNDSDRVKLRSISEKNEWLLFDEAWLDEGLREMAGQGYENTISAVVAKLIHRRKTD